MTDDLWLERVRKLLAKAEGTENPHEAEAFSAKAAALIARYRISPERLRAAVDETLAVRRRPMGKGAYVRARLALLMAVADAHDVQKKNDARARRCAASGTVSLRMAYDSRNAAVAGSFENRLS